jgi:regulator of protease activity HflC (stomatin/prohibitin superfamily)
VSSVQSNPVQNPSTHTLESWECVKQYSNHTSSLILAFVNKQNTLVTDLAPDAKVKASMNEINASRRLKEAASHKAEADKVRQIKAAEAEAESRYLSGLGVARQRKAIVQGLQESVGQFSNDVEGATPKDVMDILLLSQYFDTLSAVGANSLILEHDPATVAHLQRSVGTGFIFKGK